MTPEYKYWAFISYSHQDNLLTRGDGGTDHIRWANWLHEQLETFRVPDGYRERLTHTGESMPERFFPTFRDEAELPTSHDLGTQVRDALERSRFLIVIASPRSARSRYVNEEVRYFRELGRGDRILVLITDGEPNVRLHPKAGWIADDDCFCPALVHPLKADGTVDDTQLLLEEPIAADVRVKDIEPPREMRAAARDQPDRRALLGFMKLKLIAALMGVGLDELVLFDLVVSLKELGNTAAVNRPFAEFTVISELIAASDPSNSEWQQCLYQSLNHLGKFAMSRDDVAGAVFCFGEAKAICERLAVGDTYNQALQQSIYESLNNLGDLAMLRGDRVEALRFFSESKDIAERFKFADVGSLMSHYNMEMGMSIPPPRPPNAWWERNIAVSLEKLGDLAVAHGDLTAAMRSFAESKAIRERHAASYPANARYQSYLSTSLNKLGDLAMAQGDTAGALRCFSESKVIRERLAASDPADAALQHDLSVSLTKLHELAVTQGDTRGSLTESEDRARGLAAEAIEMISGKTPSSPEPPRPFLDENVQFTVFRPPSIEAAKWHTLLAFAHLSEKPPSAGEDEPDPLAEVERQARATLGEKFADYRELADDRQFAVPREGEITFVPVVDQVTFNPPRITFLWTEPVHRAEFRLRAAPGVAGSTLRGQITVFLGHLVLAEIKLALRVDAQPAPRNAPPATSGARPYRKIFASYSHRDAAIVEEFERYAASLGDRYLRDAVHLRAGEVWNDQLRELVREADVFQLFWSSNSMHSPFCRDEWEFALDLERVNFVRPTFWENPMPESSAEGLPSERLRRLHFQHIAFGDPLPPNASELAPDPDVIEAAPRQGSSRKFVKCPGHAQPGPGTGDFIGRDSGTSARLSRSQHGDADQAKLRPGQRRSEAYSIAVWAIGVALMIAILVVWWLTHR